MSVDFVEAKEFLKTGENIVVDQNPKAVSFDVLVIDPRGIRNLFQTKEIPMQEKRELEWWQKLDVLDKLSIGISVSITAVGLVGLLSYIPVLFDWLLALSLIGGGLSLLFTSLLLAKRLGMK